MNKYLYTGFEKVLQWRWICLLACISVPACVYDFTPEGLGNIEKMLVIEGDIIVGDYSYFRVSTTMDLESEESVGYIMDAEVWVESEMGEKIRAYPSSEMEGFYAANTSGLDVDKKYKLCVAASGGDRYESLFVPVLETPEIDSVTYSMGSDQKYIQIEITSHDAGNPENKYYKWNYQEDWEFHAEFTPILKYNSELDIVEAMPWEENAEAHYCWNKEISKAVYIASTEHLSSNVAYKQKLNKIFYDDKRISYLYSTLVSQISLTKEAYLYWKVLKTNADEMGGIFSPQPSELMGNLRSVDCPEEKVLGYISASTCTKKRIYIPASELLIYRNLHCKRDTIPHSDSRGFNLWRAASDTELVMVDYYEDDNMSLAYWTRKECTDCRYTGTKNKPSFWPNDHE